MMLWPFKTNLALRAQVRELRMTLRVAAKCMERVHFERLEDHRHIEALEAEMADDAALIAMLRAQLEPFVRRERDPVTHRFVRVS